jgi:hypothetical protein
MYRKENTMDQSVTKVGRDVSRFGCAERFAKRLLIPRLWRQNRATSFGGPWGHDRDRTRQKLKVFLDSLNLHQRVLEIPPASPVGHR